MGKCRSINQWIYTDVNLRGFMVCDESFPLGQIPSEDMSGRNSIDIGFILCGAWWLGSWGSEEPLVVKLVTLSNSAECLSLQAMAICI